MGVTAHVDLDISVGMLPVVGKHSFPVYEVLPMESLSCSGDGITVNLLGVKGVVGPRELFVDLPERAGARVADEFLDNGLQDADELGQDS